MPGINKVLTAYEATHGNNNLKEYFRERFHNVPSEYYHKRPLEDEYLVYAAKDVEDLIEVKHKMVAKL